ncbi:MAG: transglycosylase domain-containing protein [Candidatus Eisenbacteria bacterium]|uniref:Transglycosylase domain-containing protein n=1 Tax=Eiseniibacteriota bacterium TaxID=2212470 RepID=A0A948RZA8_UNCEI|nr:transglycosylase domain-containing protein [Candidatus Eisenbacteria bacterium]
MVLGKISVMPKKVKMSKNIFRKKTLLKHGWKEKIYETFSGVSTWFRRMRVGVLSAVPGIRNIRLIKLSWLVYPLMCTTVITAAIIAIGLYHIYFDRTNLPDIDSLANFEFPAIGCVYDANGQPLIELAREYRRITKYEDLPPIVRDAILATEDKNFFSHNGVEYSTIPRVLSKVRIGALMSHLTRSAGQEEVNSGGIFPQGGSTVTQQLVRGHFLQKLTAQENSKSLLHGSLLLRGLSHIIGPRSVNKLYRKLEEMRLSLWVEEEMQKLFGSKRRAKEEILARYASFIYMGNGQYGIARASEYYFGRPLATFTVDDADKAALLAGIAKSPRSYAPSAKETGRILRRRNQSWRLWQSTVLSLRTGSGRLKSALFSQSRGTGAKCSRLPRLLKMSCRSSKLSTLISALKIFCRDASIFTRLWTPVCSKL